MIYSLGDKFLVKGILCSVRYINCGLATVCPIEDTDLGGGRWALSCCSFEFLNPKGRDRDGNKATPVNKVECLAV